MADRPGVSKRQRTIMAALTGGPVTTTAAAAAVWPTTPRRKRGFVGMDLRALASRGLVQRQPDGRWSLTDAGATALEASG
jgi:hypothetical protein